MSMNGLQVLRDVGLRRQQMVNMLKMNFRWLQSACLEEIDNIEIKSAEPLALTVGASLLRSIVGDVEPPSLCSAQTLRMEGVAGKPSQPTPWSQLWE